MKGLGLLGVCNVSPARSTVAQLCNNFTRMVTSDRLYEVHSKVFEILIESIQIKRQWTPEARGDPCPRRVSKAKGLGEWCVEKVDNEGVLYLFKSF